MLTASRLEYAHAFDQAAAWLGQVRGPVVAVLSAPEYVDLVLARAMWPVVLSCDAAPELDHARARLAQGLVPGAIAQASRAVGPVETVQGERCFSGALWASPRRRSAGAKLAALARLLLPDSPLCLLSGAGLGAATGQPERLPEAVRRGLVGPAWQPAPEVRQIGSAVSLGWGVAGRLAMLARRPDLADRAERAHHLAVEQPCAAPYRVLRVRRGADRA